MLAIEKQSNAPGKPARFRQWKVWLLLGMSVLLLCFLRWGGYLIVVSGPEPAHVDAAIVLQGSISGEQVRTAGAIGLWQNKIADRVVLSIPAKSHWGEPIVPAARTFVEKQYGHELAEHVEFCETGPDVNSTEQEAAALTQCIRGHGWKSVAVVTSNYHTRRAGMIWGRVVGKQNPSLQIWICGVADPDFRPIGWWRKRLYAKTWFLEVWKLIWAFLGE
jgi:hypothetical protein